MLAEIPQRVVEFASGNKVILGRGAAVTGLAEVSLVGDVAKATADGFKSAWEASATLSP